MRETDAATVAQVLAVMLAVGVCTYPDLLRAQGEREAAASGPGSASTAGRNGNDKPAEEEALWPAIWAALRGGTGPVRWGGSTGIDLRSQQSAGSPGRRQHQEFLNLNAATYIYQPWFAQVSGSLGFLQSAENNNGNKSTGVTGSGSMQVFPISRFPFHAYFDVNDSRASGELTGSDYTNTRFGVRQTYRPAQSTATYVASYDKSTLNSGSFGNDIVNNLSGQYTNAVGPHGVDISGNRIRNTRALGEGSIIDRYTARHNWRPDETLHVDSLATFNRSNFRLLSGGVIPENRSEVTQLSSFGIWRPETEKPLTVSGGLRYFQSQTAVDNSSADTNTFSGNAAVNYGITPYTNTFAAASVTQASTQAFTGSRSALITTQSVGASHAPETWMIGKYRYGWNTSGSLSNQTGGSEGDRHNTGAQIGHNLARTDSLGGNASLITSLRQAYGVLVDSVAGNTQTLTHSASATIQKSPTPSSSVYMSASASDSRSTGVNQGEFQMLNLQMSGQLQFSRNAYGSANVTLQTYRQSNPNTPDTGFRNTMAGTVSYRHGSAFGVPRLRYSLLGQVNTLPQETRLTGDVNALRDRVTFSIEQRLDYNIGRLELRLSTRIAETNGRRSEQIFLRISRQFGAF